MPTSDGAYCVGRHAVLPPDEGSDNSFVALRTAAAILKAAGGSEKDTRLREQMELKHLELFHLGEGAAGRPGIRRVSPLGAAAIRRADFSEIARRRLANQCELVAALDGREEVSVDPRVRSSVRKNDIPLLALPVACRDRDATRARLAEANVFCAVHWQDGDWSGSSGRAATWARTFLSLPTDQRYTPEDMRRISRILR